MKLPPSNLPPFIGREVISRITLAPAPTESVKGGLRYWAEIILAGLAVCVAGGAILFALFGMSR